MKMKKMLTILVFVLASVAHGKITLTVNNQDVSSITLDVDQLCTVEVVSDDSTSYEAYVGFYNAPIIGDFSPLEIKPEAGKGAAVDRYSTSGFRGYHVMTGSEMTIPSPGVHFVFQFEAQEVGETDIKLFDDTLKIELDSLHITVIPVPMGTVFTYQGRLLDDNNPTDGPYDFEFKLYDSPVGGNQLASTIDINDLDVIDGYFTVELDFNDPNVFNGDARWLDISVRPGDGSSFTVLSPRQQLTPTPYALYAENAGADSDWMVLGDDMYSIPFGTTSPEGSLHIQSQQPEVRFEESDQSDKKWHIAGYNSGLLFAETGEGNAMYIEQGGQVGIGTTSPAEKLDVSGYVTASRYYDRDNPSYYLDPATTTDSAKFAGDVGIGTTTPEAELHIRSSSPEVRLEESDQSDKKWSISGYNSGLAFTETGEGYAMYIEQGGQVGIGTTSPESKLHIKHSQPQVMFEESDQSDKKWHIAGYNSGLVFSETGVGNAMYIEPSGNVGIRTTNPGAGLHLKGADYPSSFMFLESNINEDTGFRLYEGTTVRWHLFNESASDGFSLRNNAYSSVLFAEQSTGNVGIGTTSPDEKLTVRGGNILIESSDGTDILELGEGLDYAEGFDVSEPTKIDAGTVLIIDSDNPGKLSISVKAYDSKVAGIVAGAKGIGSGVRLGAGEFDHDVALAGRVYCNVDATQAGVEPGDLLTTSATPGYAMKAADYMRAQGAILGKAMESLEKGQKGQILVLVTLQ